MSSLTLRLEELLEKHRVGSRSGSVDADVPGVHLFWATEMIPRTVRSWAAPVLPSEAHTLAYTNVG